MNRKTHTSLLLALTLPLFITPIVKGETLPGEKTSNKQFYLAQYLDDDPMNNTPSSSEYVIEDKPSYYSPPVSIPSTQQEKPKNNSFPVVVTENDPTTYTPSASGFPTLEDKPRNYTPPTQKVTRNNYPDSARTINPAPSGNPSRSRRKSLSDLLSAFSGNPTRTNPNSSRGLLTADNALQNARYRVLVEAKNHGQQEKVRLIYPEAFTTVYNGQTVWQIGVFNGQENASSALETLKNHNLSGMMLKI